MRSRNLRVAAPAATGGVFANEVSVVFDWANASSRLLKAELAREEVTLAELTARLNGLGAQETIASVKNKLYRGTFSLAFFLQCMRALGRSNVDVASVLPEEMPKGKALVQMRPND